MKLTLQFRYFSLIATLLFCFYQNNNAQTTTTVITVTKPTDITVQCNTIPPLVNPNAQTTCANKTLTTTLKESKAPGGCPDSYIITRTWTVKDVCGSTASVAQQVTVRDTKAPILGSVPPNTTVECSKIPIAINPFVYDNCDKQVEITIKNTIVNSGACIDTYTIKREWIASDNCGNKTVKTQLITVVDRTKPVFSNFPKDATVQCDAVPAKTLVTATDNCDKQVEVKCIETRTNRACVDSYLLKREYTAIDNCGNATKATHYIAVIDNKAPVFANVPAPITVDCGQVPTVIKPTAKDNCDAIVDITMQEIKLANSTGTSGCSYILRREWTAADNCGNRSTATQNVTIVDKLAPKFTTALQNITISCSQLAQVVKPSAIDNCNNGVAITLKEIKINGTCIDSYTIKREWTATDLCGNAATVTQTVTVHDKVAPIIFGVPSNITVNCGQLYPVSTNVKGLDNCDKLVDITFKETKTNGNCTDSYTLLREWTAADNCGNTAKKTQLVTVRDNSAPIFTTFAPNLTVDCQAVPPPVKPGAVDNCDKEIDIKYTEEKIPGQCIDNYTLLRTWIAADNCGNTKSMTQSIIVRDVIAPKITGVPTNMTISCNEVATSAPLVTATDNCDKDVNITFTENISQTAPCDKKIQRIWIATDNCGNTATAVQYIFALDSKKPYPTVNIPLDITLQCDETLPSSSIVQFKDDCDTSLTVVYKEENIPIQDLCAKKVLRRWTATDDCGNAIAVSQYILIRDTKVPVITEIPVNATVECDAVPTPASPVATDNCDTNPIITYSQTIILGNCSDSYTIVRVWTATDRCGNATSAKQEVSVRDTKAPVFTTQLFDLTVQCGTSLPVLPAVVATDNCDSQVQIKLEEKVIVDSTIIDSACKGYLLRTWTAADNCGNIAKIYQRVTTIDDTPPVVGNIPTNITVECDKIPMPMQNIVATDNCLGNVAVNFKEISVTDSCAKIITRIWTATDFCGNQASGSQTIYVQDTKGPIVVNPPVSTITIGCGTTNSPTPKIEFRDNCCDSVTVSYVESALATTAGTNAQGVIRIWTAIDCCGNSTIFTQTVLFNGQDSIAPMFVAPNSIKTYNCVNVNVLAAIADPTPPMAIDNCDTDVEVSFLNMEIDTLCEGSYNFKITWLATDDAGNTATTISTIKIVDNIPPVIYGVDPEVITLPCNAPTPPIPANIYALDSCMLNPLAPINITFTEEITAGTDSCDIAKIVRRWKATDACGNFTIKTQIIYFGGSPTSKQATSSSPIATMNIRPEDNQDILAQKIETYPNPTDGMLSIQLSIKAEQVTLLNELGKVVIQRNDVEAGTLQIDMTTQHNGIYLLTVKTNNHIQTKRVVVLKH